MFVGKYWEFEVSKVSPDVYADPDSWANLDVLLDMNTFALNERNLKFSEQWGGRRSGKYSKDTF